MKTDLSAARAREQIAQTGLRQDLIGARTSFRLDGPAFRYVEDARLRSRMRHGKAIDRGKLVSSVMHGLENAGFDLSEPEPELIAIAIAQWFRSGGGHAL